MSETKTVSRKCYSEHLLQCLPELQQYKNDEVPKLLDDYVCRLTYYYSGSDEGSYYGMECDGSERHQPSAHPVQAQTESENTLDIERVSYECSINYGKMLENLGKTLLEIETGAEMSVEVNAASIREQFQECKMNLLRKAASRFGSLDQVSSVQSRSDRINIMENGEVYMTVKMWCSKDK